MRAAPVKDEEVPVTRAEVCSLRGGGDTTPMTVDDAEEDLVCTPICGAARGFAGPQARRVHMACSLQADIPRLFTEGRTAEGDQSSADALGALESLRAQEICEEADELECTPIRRFEPWGAGMEGVTPERLEAAMSGAPTAVPDEDDLAVEAEVVAQIDADEGAARGEGPGEEWDEEYDWDEDVGDDDDDESDDDAVADETDDEDGGGGAAGSSAAQPGKKKKCKEAERYEKHQQAVEMSFAGFKCGCARSKAAGMDSCLEQFTKATLREIHRETYPIPDAKAVHSTEVQRKIHEKYWSRAEALSPLQKAASKDGHVMVLPRPLRLHGVGVCDAAFRAAIGGARYAHRHMLSLTLRGYSPTSLTGAQQAKVLLKASEARNGRCVKQASYARVWWANELALHEWLPNENVVRFRGPPWYTVFEQCYKPTAKAQSGLPALSYKAWKKQMNPAARELCEQREGNTQSSRGVRCKRSANHSNFPECNECKTRRSEFMKVMCNGGSSQAQREGVLARRTARMMEHFNEDEWQEDRRVA